MSKYTGDVGCLLDSHTGRYNIPRVIGIALDYGMPMEDQDAEYWANKEDDPDSEYMIEWSQASEEWLNENVADEGFMFGWMDGDFFYQSENWWEDAV
jgi:hypothetical protein